RQFTRKEQLRLGVGLLLVGEGRVSEPTVDLSEKTEVSETMHVLLSERRMLGQDGYPVVARTLWKDMFDRKSRTSFQFRTEARRPRSDSCLTQGEPVGIVPSSHSSPRQEQS